MSLYGNNDKNQNVLISKLEREKIDKEGGVFVPPIEDPHVVGALWNNAGTPTISAG